MAEGSSKAGKLVRDRVPDIVRGQGGEPSVRTLPEGEYAAALRAKLAEEVEELLAVPEADLAGELADVLEVLRALAAESHLSWEAVESLRDEKRRDRGGFDGRIWLAAAEAPDDLVADGSSALWPPEFPVASSGGIEEGLVVMSRSGRIEGRTTGARTRCPSRSCPGWVIGVAWETGQTLWSCSQAWSYDPGGKTVRLTRGGDISARVVNPPPLGVAPLPRERWPSRAALARHKGWRVNPGS